MGMHKLVGLVIHLFRRPGLECDDQIDNLIREALLDETLARPPRDAWERLRQVIVDRQRQRYGMWVLDEPQHDPPAALPMLLNGPAFDHAQRIYDGRQSVTGPNLRRDVFWVGLAPAFTILAHW